MTNKAAKKECAEQFHLGSAQVAKALVLLARGRKISI